MIAYKGFNEDFRCRGFQYDIGETYKMKGGIKCCDRGFHACTNPMDVWRYYLLTKSRFAKVELSGEMDSKLNDDSKLCASQIKILEEISVEDYIKLCVEWMKENNKDTNKKSTYIWSGKYGDKIKSSFVNGAQIGSCGNNTTINTFGIYTQIGSVGDNATIESDGDYIQIGSCGDNANIESYGYSSEIFTYGDNAQIKAFGNNINVASYGNNAVIICNGRFNKVKAKKGSSITLTEWEWDGHRGFIPMCIKTEYVDGEHIKENTWYKLENGKFVEII